MKKTLLSILALISLLFCSIPADAQYYEIANRLPSLIQPMISGSGRYKGFLEAGYSKTLGKYDADFIEISTSQGYSYNSWFYMGVGIGADILFSHRNDSWGENWVNPDDAAKRKVTQTAVMLPLFTDFRANLGNTSGATFFIDLKVGCSFLLGNKYIGIGDGYLTNQQYFYLRPTLGMRIPTNSKNPKQAVDLGVNYKLLTSNYWNSWSRNITLNAIGVSVAYEW